MGLRRRQFLIGAGGVLAAPLGRAQRSRQKMLLGVLAPIFAPDAPFWQPFFVALRERGWREGADYRLEVKETRGDPLRALALAKALVEQGPDVVFALSTGAAVSARQATSTIPIVTWCGYPVESGLAASLARPGGNVTGVANYANADVWGKLVEFLRELKPRLNELGVLWDYVPPNFPDGLIPLPAIERGARQLGIKSTTWMVRTARELGDALAAIERAPVEALVMTQGGGVHNQPAAMGRIGELLARRRLPAIIDIAGSLFLRSPGCLLAYSPNVLDLQGRLAHLIDRVLRGASPRELPFQLPAKFDLAINAKTARTLGLEVPPGLLLRADRLIE